MRTVTLGKACEIVSGATPKSGVKDYWGGDVAWATPADLSNLDGPYIATTPRTLTAAGLASCSSRMLPVGSVLLSSRAPIGHVAINTVPMATNQGFKSLIPHSQVLDGKYLFHWLRYKKEYLQSIGNGATFKELSKATLERVEVPAPPLDEQRRIAAILDQESQLMSAVAQGLGRARGIGDVVFRAMFAGRSTSLDRVEHVSIGELLTLKSGNFLPAKAQGPGVHAVYGGNGINGSHDAYMFEDPVVVIGRVGAYCGAVHLTGSRVWVTDNALYVAKTAREMSPIFLSAALRMSHLNQYASQSGQPLISASRIAEVRLPVPLMCRQREFEERIQALDACVKRLNVRGEHIRELGSALRARAFSGQL